MDTWQYKTLSISLEGPVDEIEVDKTLNQLGGDGWELLAVTPLNFKQHTGYLVYHFRRLAKPERRVGFVG
nr:hypothetical protein [uncultured bacterium]